MELVIIGAGRVGTALAARLARAGVDVYLVSRHEGWARVDAALSGPIVVATRNDDLDAVVARVPPARHADLVFVQNGMLRPWLRARGLAGCGRGLLFFAVPARGDDLQPGGTSPFCGPHADVVVAALTSADVPAEVVTPGAFVAVELEKLVWNSAFGLLCEAIGGDVGAALDDPGCDALLGELIDIGAADLGIDVDRDAMIARLRSYSASIPSYRGAVKEWPWRNGYFVAAVERVGGGEVHRAWLGRRPA